VRAKLAPREKEKKVLTAQPAVNVRRKLSRRATNYQLAFAGQGTGRPEFDRLVTTYRAHHNLEGAERELPNWTAADQAVASRVRAILGASAALLALSTAAAAFVNKAAGLQGTEVLLSVGVAIAILVAVLVSPLGRTLIRELPEVLGVRLKSDSRPSSADARSFPLLLAL
jgi:hypothetical protein